MAATAVQELQEMVKIEALIRPFQLIGVQDALVEAGVLGMTVTEVNGLGPRRGHLEYYSSAKYTPDFVLNLLLSIIVPEEQAEDVIQVLLKTINNGNLPAGQIFVSKISNVLCIRTGEKGIRAL